MEWIIYTVLGLVFAIPGWLGSIFIALCLYGLYSAALGLVDNKDPSR